MNTTPIVPARIVVDADGTPRSDEYGDIYHPRGGALAQARHVFLDNGAVAARWRGRDRFVVLETGFGLGNNFLATWAEWRADAARCRQLQFLSIERSPPDRATLAAVARDPALSSLAAELEDRWPPLTCNLHRIAFEGGAVELLLAFGDVADWLPQLTADVDAFFLDGFAPARNPAMWDARLFKAMARMAAPGATVATWSAARTVRDGLARAGFEVALAPGSAGKRDITRARFAPRFEPAKSLRRSAPLTIDPVGAGPHGDADVVIVGGGLAGCALAARLARDGLRSLIVERNGHVAAEASGNPAALFHGIVHRADGRHARFHRAAGLAAAIAVRDAIGRSAIPGSVAGLLRLETTLDLHEMRDIVAAQSLPPDYVRALDAAEAGAVAGLRWNHPAWHYAHGGWVDPRALASSWLASAGAHVRLCPGRTVRALRRDGGCWIALGDDGAAIAAAPALVLCDGSGGVDLLGAGAWPVRRQRGQLGVVAGNALAAVPRVPVAGHGHAVATDAGDVWFGTTTTFDDDEAALRPLDHAHNLERLGALLGDGALQHAGGVATDALRGRTAFRWVSVDRLPIIGAVPAAVVAHRTGTAPAVSGRLDQPRFIERAPGLFVFAALGSRGIASACLGAEMLGAAIAGAAVPAEADLLDAVDPARFASRAFRRAESARAAASIDQPPVGSMAGSAGG